jgi:nuclear pore complex protein Nup98-Nup96
VLSVALNPKLEFSQLLDSIVEISCFAKSEIDLWKLCSALWDRIPASEQLDTTYITVEQAKVTREALRKEEFSNWLKLTIKPFIDQELVDASNADSLPDAAYAQSLFSLLSGRQMASAIKEAVSHKDFKLALVLSQLGGAGSRISNGQSCGMGVIGRSGTDESVMESCLKQVDVWQKMFEDDQRTANLIDKNRLMCWTLCSGDVDEMLKKEDDWKKSFGMLFWYKEGGIYSIREIVKMHATAVSSGMLLYLNCEGGLNAPEANATAIAGDCLFNLLNLFCESPDYPLEACLDSKSYSTSRMDVREPWIVYTILNRAKKAIDIRDVKVGDNLCVAFAFQLEVLGLWDIGCFVAMFLSESGMRCSLIRHLLDRNFPLGDLSGSCLNGITNGVRVPVTEQWKFLVETLRIPKVWIHEAKVVRSRYEENWVAEIGCLIDAGQFFLAHRYLFTHLLAGSIIDGMDSLGLFLGEYFYLKTLLGLIDQNVVGSNWVVGGGLVLTFIEIVEELPDVIELALGSSGAKKEAVAKKAIVEKWGPSIRGFFEAVVKAERFNWVKNYWKRDNLEDGSRMLGRVITEMTTRVSVLLGSCEGVVDVGKVDLDMLEDLPLGSCARIRRVARYV